MNQNNSLYETDYEDLFGHPYPQVISFEEVRGFFIDELHHNVVMSKDSGFFTSRSEKKYYQGRLDAIQDIFMKIKGKSGKISEPQFRPRTWRGISEDKRFEFCMHCRTDLSKYPKDIKYCPECGRCFMTPEEREWLGLVPDNE